MIEARRCWVLDEGLVHSRSWTPEAAGSYETAASFLSRSCNPGISKRTNHWQTAVLKSFIQKLLLNWKQHLPYSAWVCSWLQWEPDIPPDISRGELKPKDSSQLSNMLEKTKTSTHLCNYIRKNAKSLLKNDTIQNPTIIFNKIKISQWRISIM